MVSSRQDATRLAVKQLFELKTFVEKKHWIDERIDFVASLETVDAFEPLPPAASAIGSDKLAEWSAELSRLERQVDEFDLGDLTALRLFAKDASKQQLSGQDADLIDITLGTLLSVDKLLHLLAKRRKSLLTLAFRLDWDELVKTCMASCAQRCQELESLQRSVDAFLQKPAKECRQAAETYRLLNEKVTQSLADEIRQASTVLDDMIDVAPQIVPDPFLDEQDRLESQLASICHDLQLVPSALERAEKLANIATRIDAFKVRVEDSQSLVETADAIALAKDELASLRSEAAPYQAALKVRLEAAQRRLESAESDLRDRRVAAETTQKAREALAQLDTAKSTLSAAIDSLLRSADTKQWLGTDDILSYDDKDVTSKQARVEEALVEVSQQCTKASSIMAAMARQGVRSEVRQDIKQALLSASGLQHRAKETITTTTRANEVILGLKKSWEQQNSRLELLRQRQALLSNLVLADKWDVSKQSLSENSLPPFEAQQHEIVGTKDSADLTDSCRESLRRLDEEAHRLEQTCRNLLSLRSAVRKQTSAVLVAQSDIVAFRDEMSSLASPEILLDLQDRIQDWSRAVWSRIPMLDDGMTSSEPFGLIQTNERIRSHINEQVLRLRADLSSKLNAAPVEQSLSSSIIVHSEGEKSDEAAADINLKSLLQRVPSLDSLARLDKRHSLALAFPTDDEVKQAKDTLQLVRSELGRALVPVGQEEELHHTLASKAYVVNRLEQLNTIKHDIDAVDSALSDLLNALDAATDAERILDPRLTPSTSSNMAPSDALHVATDAVTKVRKAAVSLIDDYRVKHAVARIETTFTELQSMIDDLERRPPSVSSSHSSLSSSGRAVKSKPSQLPVKTPQKPSGRSTSASNHGVHTSARDHSRSVPPNTPRSVSADGYGTRGHMVRQVTPASSRHASSTMTPKPKQRYQPDSRKVDKEIAKIVNELPMNVPIQAAQQDRYVDESGLYWIGDKLYFCRILRSKMTMVRIGGGWSELSAFLCAHFGSQEAEGVKLSPASTNQRETSRSPESARQARGKTPDPAGLNAALSTPTVRRTSATQLVPNSDQKTPSARKGNAPERSAPRFARRAPLKVIERNK